MLIKLNIVLALLDDWLSKQGGRGERDKEGESERERERVREKEPITLRSTVGP